MLFKINNNYCPLKTVFLGTICHLSDFIFFIIQTKFRIDCIGVGPDKQSYTDPKHEEGR